MGDILWRVAQSSPEQTALITTADANEKKHLWRLSYGEAAQLVDRAANGYQQLGLQHGDVCVVVCDNSAEALLTKIALARAGVVVAPLNPTLDGDVMRRIVERVEPKAVILDKQHLGKFAETGFILRDFIVPYVIDVGGDENPTDHESFTKFVEKYDPDYSDPQIAGDDIWQLLFTSGSTSDPKAAMVSHTNTYMSALSWQSTTTHDLRQDSDCVLASGLPLIYHVGDALAYSAWLNSGAVLLMRKPDPAQTARVIVEQKVTSLWGGLPQFLRLLLPHLQGYGHDAASSLKAIIFGWAPLDKSTFLAYQELNETEVGLVAIIGMTEVVVAHRFWLNNHPELLSDAEVSDNYVGKPHGALAAKLFDPLDEASEAPTYGEVRYRSPALMAGYYKNEDATQDSLGSGWFRSGDIFRVGNKDQRIMHDRLKDVIKTGGENVSSIRVEAVLESHPAVDRAAVIGVPDRRWGEAVTAVVILNDEVTADELIAYSKQRLAKFEVPKAVHFVEELPVSVGGKLQKFRLVQQLG